MIYQLYDVNQRPPTYWETYAYDVNTKENRLIYKAYQSDNPLLHIRHVFNFINNEELIVSVVSKENPNGISGYYRLNINTQQLSPIKVSEDFAALTYIAHNLLDNSLVIADATGEPKLINLENEEEIKTGVPCSNYLNAEWSIQNDFILVICQSGIWLFDLQTKESTQIYDQPQPIETSTKITYVWDFPEGQVFVIDMSNEQVRQALLISIPNEITTNSVTLNPDNTPITQTVTPTLNLHYPQKKAILYEDFNKIYLSNFIDEDRLIAEGSFLIRNPQAVSPDHTKVIMQTEDKQDVVLNLETYEITLLSSWGVNGLYGEYVWSNDNSKLGYISLEGGSNSYYLNYYHLESKTIKQYLLSDEAFIAFLRGWSFDDRYFALQMITNGQSDLYIFDNLTESLVQMTNTPDVELDASWSPNSYELLIGSNSDPNVFNNTTYPYESETLFIMNIDKKQEVLLESLDVTTFAWHPSATKIAYSYNLGTLCFLTIASKETNCPEFEEFPLEDYSFSFSTIPVWSQDGEWLLLAIEKVECGMIYALNPETGEFLQPKSRANCLSGGGVYYWIGQ